jgi:hypothetical protein
MNLDAIMYDMFMIMYVYVKYKLWLGQVKNVKPMTFLGFPNRPA